MVEFQLVWNDWFLCCTGPGDQHDSGERHSKRLDHVQSEYRWSDPSGPSEWNKTNSFTAACSSLPSNLLQGELHYSWRHSRPPPGHLHPAAQMEEGMWHVQDIQLQLEMKPSYQNLYDMTIYMNTIIWVSIGTRLHLLLTSGVDFYDPTRNKWIFFFFFHFSIYAEKKVSFA